MYYQIRSLERLETWRTMMDNQSVIQKCWHRDGLHYVNCKYGNNLRCRDDGQCWWIECFDRRTNNLVLKLSLEGQRWESKHNMTNVVSHTFCMWWSNGTPGVWWHHRAVQKASSLLGLDRRYIQPTGSTRRHFAMYETIRVFSRASHHPSRPFGMEILAVIKTLGVQESRRPGNCSRVTRWGWDEDLIKCPCVVICIIYSGRNGRLRHRLRSFWLKVWPDRSWL